MEPTPPAPPEPNPKPKGTRAKVPHPGKSKPVSERVTHDATGAVQSTSFRLPLLTIQQIADLVAEHTDRTGHPTSATNMLVALVRAEHAKRCRTRPQT